MSIYFYRVLSSWWRLILSMFIGLFLYVYTFIYYDDFFTTAHEYSKIAIERVEEAGKLTSNTTKWFKVLNIEQKIVFMVFIMFARLMLAFVTYFLFVLPLRLMGFGSREAAS